MDRELVLYTCEGALERQTYGSQVTFELLAVCGFTLHVSLFPFV